MKEQFVEDLEDGQKVNSLFSVKYKKSLKKYKNGYMFTLGLADRTDEIEAKFWGGKNKEKVEKLFSKISPGDVLKIKGKTSIFQNRLQINVEEGNLEKTEKFEIEDFVKSSEKDIGEMLEELKSKFKDMKNTHLKELVFKFLEDENFVKKFKESPAAMYYHHAHIGGLLEHTLDMINLAETLHKSHPKLDLDLLKIGCFIHDIGKVKEFEVTTNIKQSRSGLLSGHIFLGHEMVLKRIEKIEDFPEKLAQKLLHIISSHHGKRENGAVKEPMFPEALAIHYLDELDSKVVQLIDLKNSAKTKDFHIWNRRFGQIYLE